MRLTCMPTTPVASVVIRVRNEARYLPETLTAVEAQSLQPLEIIVVDSGSTDGSVALACQHGARLIAIPPSSFSYGHAINVGAAAACGPYVVLLSAHAVPCDRDWLARLIAPFADRRVAATYSRMLPRPDTPLYQQLNTILMFDLLPTILGGPAMMYHNTASAIRRDVWEVARFDETLPACEDTEWARRIVRLSYRVVFVRNAVVRHSHNESWRAFAVREGKHAQAWLRMLLGPRKPAPG